MPLPPAWFCSSSLGLPLNCSLSAKAVAIIVIAMMSHFALSALEQPTGLAYATDGVRIDPSWIMPSTQP
jgi:hypothetical protein